MALTSKKVGLIIVLIVLSLTGLVVLQAALLNYAMELERQSFDQNVRAALSQISQSLSTGEAITMAFSADSSLFRNQAVDREIRAIIAVDMIGNRDTAFDSAFFMAHSSDMIPLTSVGGNLKYSLPSEQRLSIRIFDPETGLDTTLIDSVLQPGNYEFPIDPEHFSKGSYIRKTLSARGEKPKSVMWVDGGFPTDGIDSGKRTMIARIYRDLISAEFEPIEKRLDSINVDSIISSSLIEAGIDLSYAYGVLTEGNDSLRVISESALSDEVRGSDYKVRLFQNDMFAPTAFLALYFPESGAYLWGQITPLLLGTIVLMLIIIACFVYTIRTIFNQRRFSELMIQFINNMTHEFKTPISTVALATEAIQRPEVLASAEKTLQFSEIIKTENRRMRNQAEKILQMATLEEKDFVLSRERLDMHRVIADAVDSIQLRVTDRKGSIVCHLNAKIHKVSADRVHLSNIIHNLLDNAVKYSENAPQITVRTYDSDRGLGIRIEDCGIGISAEDQKHVFDKYFRTPTGNRHDVKGFGLGLSYVKLMVEAHGGRISLNSKLGEGTEIEIVLPPVEKSGTST